MDLEVILVGCGNMGYAMLRGWLTSGKLRPERVAVVEPNEELRIRASELGVAAFSSAKRMQLVETPQIIVLAVKPQVIRMVLADYVWLGNSLTTFVSVAAGTTIETFQQVLGRSTPVMRCMPNMPSAIGKGMIVTFASPQVTDGAYAGIINLLSASGTVTSVQSEELMGAVTAVSGSGPAYVFYFIEALAAAGQSVGLPGETAMLLAQQTVYGAASLVMDSANEPSQLRDQVTSPNGTTQAGLEQLMCDEGLTALLTKAIRAARDREIALGGQSGSG
ncbi:pyrroline-5-carboxylate reductase [Brucella cytisi]|uniref:pyrroline-5-carboxylate reductase n=1 Tax=Brucella cytisi TaxID=407152 RepID=UPI0035DB4C1E